MVKITKKMVKIAKVFIQLEPKKMVKMTKKNGSAARFEGSA
jgi:hypothetical protein